MVHCFSYGFDYFQHSIEMNTLQIKNLPLGEDMRSELFVQIVQFGENLHD